MDACNPIEDAPPENGVLRFFTDIQRVADGKAAARVQRGAFCEGVQFGGHRRMVNPQFEGGKPTMFICGNDEAAKKQVSQVHEEFGWETADMGTAEAARAIEPLCMLWCIPGFLRNEWTHAFKLLVK